MTFYDRYRTASAFRQALDAQLRSRATSPTDMERLRRSAAYERLLARLFAEGDAAPWTVKGGYVLDVRLPSEARRTKDLDLGLATSAVGAAPVVDDAVRRLLDGAMSLDLLDWFGFRRLKSVRLGFDAEDEIDVLRSTVEAVVDGKPFVSFILDVGVEAAHFGRREWLTRPSFFGFAGAAATRFAFIDVARHLAEKLHALTRPRGDRENTRVKDLVDVVLLMERLPPSMGELRSAVAAVFAERNTHDRPVELPPSPARWTATYETAAADVGTTAKSLAEAERRARDLWSLLGAAGPVD